MRMLILMSLLAVIAFSVWSGWHPPGCVCPRGCWGPATACRSNLKNLATGLEMYAQDHKGRYPANLAALSPNYLRTLPMCPCGGPTQFCVWHWCQVPRGASDTYSPGYAVSTAGDRFTVVCSGYHHKAVGLGPNCPQYTSEQGLLP